MKKVIIPCTKENKLTIDLIDLKAEDIIVARSIKDNKVKGFVQYDDDTMAYFIKKPNGDPIDDAYEETIIDLIKKCSNKYTFEVID